MISVEDCISTQRFHLLSFLVDLTLQYLSERSTKYLTSRLCSKNLGYGILHVLALLHFVFSAANSVFSRHDALIST